MSAASQARMQFAGGDEAAPRRRSSRSPRSCVSAERQPPRLSRSGGESYRRPEPSQLASAAALGATAAIWAVGLILFASIPLRHASSRTESLLRQRPPWQRTVHRSRGNRSALDALARLSRQDELPDCSGARPRYSTPRRRHLDGRRDRTLRGGRTWIRPGLAAANQADRT
jgi:hypothetical protein